MTYEIAPIDGRFPAARATVDPSTHGDRGAETHRAASVDGRRRMTLDLPATDVRHLTNLEERSRYNKTTTIGRALQLLDLLDEHARDGGSIVLENVDGTRERLRIL